VIPREGVERHVVLDNVRALLPVIPREGVERYWLRNEFIAILKKVSDPERGS
jgi:hypothetical protein